MCFRPAEVQAPQVCPECGKEFAVIAGIRQEKCPFCGADMPSEEMAPPMPAAPASPSIPSAPGTPSAPQVSNVSKAFQ